jgi:eukaryotic-like serine/threonine-protein kinase
LRAWLRSFRTLVSGTLCVGDLAWIVMDSAEGQDLKELVEQRAGLELAAARAVLGQLFSALSAAHSAGIVHGDLKPQNVRVGGQGDVLTVKVLDFGLAKPSPTDARDESTALWRAPEQAREGDKVLPSADVWALGLLTFFVLTGVPYSLTTAPGVERALPAGFDAWFTRALTRDPAARFPGAAAAWAELEPLLSRPRSERRALVLSRPAAFLTLVILSCIAMGVAIFWLLRSARI